MRRRDEALWFNLPGVVTAYQPVAAPGPLLARQNVSHDARRAGVHTAKDGAAPSWAAHSGWTFDTSQYLLSSAVPISQNTSMLVQFSNHAATGHTAICGWELPYTATVGLSGCWGGTASIYWNGTDGVYLYKAPQLLAGNLAYAGLYAYRNGIAESGTFTPGWGGTFSTIKLGGSSAGAGAAWTGSIQAYVLVDYTLSPAEVMLAARQMAYCHVNPDWSAWGRRRRYYYAPAAAGGAAKMNTYYRRMRS